MTLSFAIKCFFTGTELLSTSSADMGSHLAQSDGLRQYNYEDLSPNRVLPSSFPHLNQILFLETIAVTTGLLVHFLPLGQNKE